MEDGTHGGTNDFGIKVVNGRINDGDIIEVHGGSGADDGAEVAGVGRIDEDEVVSRRVEFGVELGEFGNQKTAILGAEDIEGLLRFDNFDVGRFESVEQMFEVASVRDFGAQKDAQNRGRSGFEKLVTESGAKSVRYRRSVLITRKLHIYLL